MTVRPRITARGVLRGVVALGVAIAAGFAASQAGLLVLLAIVFARDESMWEPRYVYNYGVEDVQRSDAELLDIYAQPPLGVPAWLGLSALIAAAYAITVWGLWLTVRALISVRGQLGSGRRWPKLERIAASAFVWGIVALSAYSLGVFLWDWIEWRNLLDQGITFANDPKPEPNPAFNPWQVPWGIVAFAVVGALPLVVRSELRKRRRP